MSDDALFEGAPGAGEVVKAIRPLKNDPSRCAVVVGRRKEATLDRSQVESLGLCVGAAWTAELAERVHEAAGLLKAKRDALRALSMRARSRGQIIESLMRKGHGRTTAEAAADHMTSIGLLDDRAYAEMAVRDELARKPAGRMLLVSKLAQKKIGRELAEEVVAAALAERDGESDAIELAKRRARTFDSRLSSDAARRRLFAYLARRGFDPQLCRRGVEAALGRGER
ncbi:MAG: regulatory protein RecX [Phycisphaeraceae bacterium]|nr:MAG: regulatory protein RecX [Phycisphaeraceae bacterium]